MKGLGVLCVVVGLAAASPAGHACCHGFGFGDTFTEACFTDELLRLVQAPSLPKDARWGWTRETRRVKWLETRLADRCDVLSALRGTGLSQNEMLEIVGRYESMRAAMKEHADENMLLHRSLAKVLAQPEEEASSPPPGPTLFSMDGFDDLLAQLPREFVLYAEGAALYGAERYEEAAQTWSSLLALPESERRYRSTWAAFMCGKAWLKVDPAKAATYFKQTRELAQDGFMDSLDLSTASLGWQGRAGIESNDYYDSIKCYYALLKGPTEEERNVALESMATPCRAAARQRPFDVRIVKDPECFNVMIAHTLSESRLYIDGWRSRASVGWLESVSDAGVDLPPSLAGRVAWLAYEGGDFDHAAIWAHQAEEKCPYGRWIRAKLALRLGKVDEGRAILRETVLAPHGEEKWFILSQAASTVDAQHYVYGALAALMLDVGLYDDALQTYRHSQDREEAAYVAERVMTIEELETFITDHEGEPCPDGPTGTWRRRGGLPMTDLRYLCGRRLARTGKLREARQYFPEGLMEVWSLGYGDEKYVEICKVLDVLVDRLANGRDASLPKVERAEHLFKAAEITRQWGMELYGTEFVPDMFAWHGQGEGHAPKRVLPPNDTTEEARRYQEHAPTPDKRFHYRYRAADLMWECAELLPDNDPMTARALYTGGMYLAEDDAEAADRFYKALVHRCGDLPLGKQADEERWFPKEPEF